MTHLERLLFMELKKELPYLSDEQLMELVRQTLEERKEEAEEWERSHREKPN